MRRFAIQHQCRATDASRYDHSSHDGFLTLGRRQPPVLRVKVVSFQEMCEDFFQAFMRHTGDQQTTDMAQEGVTLAIDRSPSR